MSARKIWFLTALSFPLLCVTGCMGDGGQSRSASRARTTRGQKDVAAKPKKAAAPERDRKKENLDDLSPEASMQRDLARLRERERQQAKAVGEMRNALNQGQDIVTKEEQNLRDLQGQISKYEMAMRRYENVVPEAEQRGGSQAMASRRDNAQAGRSGSPDGEVMLYDGRADSRFAAGPGASDPGPSRNAAPRPQPEYARTAPAAQPDPARDRAAGRDSWEAPAYLFDARPAGPPLAAVPTPRRAEPISAMAAPAGQPLRPTHAPAANRPNTFETPASVPAAGATFDDEVFTPDLFLSSGK